MTISDLALRLAPDEEMLVVRRPRGRLRTAVVCGVLLATAALGMPPSGARPYDPAAAQPPPDPTGLLSRLQTLYLQAESATESYDQATQVADVQRAKAEAIDRQLAGQRVKFAASRDEAGLMARQMYRDGGLSPYLSLLTGKSPQDFFVRKHLLDRAAGHQKDVLADLAAGRARLVALNTRAQHALDKAQHARSLQAAKKTQIEGSLRQVETALAGLTGAQIAQVQTLEQRGADQAQQNFMDGKPLGDDPAGRAPSAAGDRALAYAFRQLGKPYVWGAQGPDAFDCSGLTSQAWAYAGVPVPRTSQQQWARLPHVPLALLRPGDLVVYFSGATHVALYAGDGMVVQAPRPGAVVKVSPIAANPVLGAVRPDAGDPPLAHYTPRPIPPQALAPTPIGLPAAGGNAPAVPAVGAGGSTATPTQAGAAGASGRPPAAE